MFLREIGKIRKILKTHHPSLGRSRHILRLTLFGGVPITTRALRRLDDSSVRSFCIGWFDDILEKDAEFNKKPVNIRGGFYNKSKKFQVLDQKVDRIPKMK